MPALTTDELVARIGCTCYQTRVVGHSLTAHGRWQGRQFQLVPSLQWILEVTEWVVTSLPA